MPAGKKTPEKTAFGSWVREGREKLGLSPDELGRRIGLTGHTVGQIERGYQNMGRSAIIAFRALVETSADNGTSASAVAESPGNYSVARSHAADSPAIGSIVALATDPSIVKQAHKVAKILNLGDVAAITLVIEQKLKAGKGAGTAT